MKWKIVIPPLALTLGLATTAIAAGFSSPAGIVTDLTDLSATEVAVQRADGKTHGQIAAAKNVSEQFRDKTMEYRSQIIDQRVADKAITLEQGATLKERLANCKGTPGANQERLGQRLGGGLRWRNKRKTLGSCDNAAAGCLRNGQNKGYQHNGR